LVNVTSVTGEQREGIPPYLRIAAALRERILAGELQPGQMLPSATRIAQEEGVAKITAAKALKILHSEGLAYSVQGWGTFVAGDAQAD
jgi:DNA-binding GntR family transcriptional regulator